MLMAGTKSSDKAGRLDALKLKREIKDGEKKAQHHIFLLGQLWMGPSLAATAAECCVEPQLLALIDSPQKVCAC